MDLSRINQLSAEQAKEEFLRCCHSAAWANEMTQQMPFKSQGDLFSAAETVWRALKPDDWLEAFQGHPRIGQDMESLRAKFKHTADWSSSEQSGVNGASEEVLRHLSEANRIYEQQFGYIFIVCATGKNAVEMLNILKTRLDNPPEKELLVAMSEQEKITRIRLEKLTI